MSGAGQPGRPAARGRWEVMGEEEDAEGVTVTSECSQLECLVM